MESPAGDKKTTSLRWKHPSYGYNPSEQSTHLILLPEAGSNFLFLRLNPKIGSSRGISFPIMSDNPRFRLTRASLFPGSPGSLGRWRISEGKSSRALLINRGSYFSIHFTENEVERHRLSTRKLQSAASIGSYILEGWQSNVIYFPSNAIKAHFEVWRDEKLAVNFGLPINFVVEIDTVASFHRHLSEILRNDAYRASSRFS